MGRKRSKRGSGSSVNSEDMSADGSKTYQVKDAIDALREAMEAGFAGLRSDMDRLRYEFKSDVEKIEHEMKEITQGLNSAQGDVEMLKEKIDKDSKETTTELDALRSKVVDLELRLNAEIENNVRLEQYTRRENLRFNNINETDGEDCKAIIYNIIDNDLGIGKDGIRFHAVHRVGKKAERRCRPIIARFVSREDRDKVWKNRSKIKNSGNHTDAYITEDFAKKLFMKSAKF